MYVHSIHPAMPAAWEGTCPYVPKGPGTGWCRGAVGTCFGPQGREEAVGTWEVSGSEATSVEGDACGTSRIKRSAEPKMEGGSLWQARVSSGTGGSAGYLGNRVIYLWAR